MWITRANQISQGDDWEHEFAIALESLNDDPHLEPLLKIQLLQLVADIAAKGSIFMQAAIQPELKLLESPPVDFNANWIDPTDEEGKNARAQARMILKRVRPLKPLFKNATKERDAFAATLDKRLEWIGYLWKDPKSGQWECRPTTANTEHPGNLYILIPPNPDGTGGKKIVVKEIGQVSHGLRIESISLTTSTGLAIGRPVYLLRTKSDSQ